MTNNKKATNKIPSYDKMMLPTLEALKQLGGSGSLKEINETVYKIANYDEDILEILHNDDGFETEVEYRLAWARTYLKKFGLIENSSRGIWTLLDNDIDISTLDSDKIVKFIRKQTKKNKPIPPKKKELQNDEIEDEIEEQLNWKEELLTELLKLDPSAFERLSQRLLRESGFIQVEVTGKSGDGGIDGKGIARINGFLSFHIYFQCKRYKGSVGSGDIRDFRGAMQGRADKGLFITTGNYTREAIKEAARDGAPPIDLIDGDQLCEKLKEFKLGVKTEIIEKVSITPEWFLKI